MNCPLCESTKTVSLKSLQVALLVSRWEQDFGIDVRSEFGDVRVIELRKCRDCALSFFHPDSVAGSPALYEVLEKIDWYYLPRKWEHDVALEDIKGARNGIEIGCGFGDFVARVNREMEIPFDGCELNPSAVQIARSKGVSLLLDDSENLARRYAGSYDVVCSFQVLEHVNRPRNFLQNLCDLVRPGGKLLLGLPNANSLLKYQFNLFDLPPHHMTRWTVEVLKRLQAWFPLKLVRVAYEPLGDCHLDAYLQAYSDLFRAWSLGISAWPITRSGMTRVIGHPRVRRFLRDQGFYASYLRT
jgi:SAM-dependent methyltransferase